MNRTNEWYDRFYAGSPAAESAWYRAILKWLINNHVAGPLLELGCGRGALLAELHREGRFAPDELFGIEQSAVAIAQINEILPNVRVGDVEGGLPFGDQSIGVVVLAEVIEHIASPRALLLEIRRVLRHDGVLLLTFPNYTNLPWLAVRILAQLLRKPNWIVLQPIDHIFFYHTLKRLLFKAGFAVDACVGTVYFPPLIYRYESERIDAALEGLRLSTLSFHPLMILRPLSEK